MTIALNVDLVAVDCGECGGTYAINERYNRQKQENGGTWNCPYCKVSWGYVKSEVTKLKEKLEAEYQRRMREQQKHDQTKAALKDTENQRRAEKAAKTRIKNRVASGICPCCNRTFKDLAAHMATKHPSYAQEEPC